MFSKITVKKRHVRTFTQGLPFQVSSGIEREEVVPSWGWGWSSFNHIDMSINIFFHYFRVLHQSSLNSCWTYPNFPPCFGGTFSGSGISRQEAPLHPHEQLQGVTFDLLHGGMKHLGAFRIVHHARGQYHGRSGQPKYKDGKDDPTSLHFSDWSSRGGAAVITGRAPTRGVNLHSSRQIVFRHDYRVMSV